MTDSDTAFVEKNECVSRLTAIGPYLVVTFAMVTFICVTLPIWDSPNSFRDLSVSSGSALIASAERTKPLMEETGCCRGQSPQSWSFCNNIEDFKSCDADDQCDWISGDPHSDECGIIAMNNTLQSVSHFPMEKYAEMVTVVRVSSTPSNIEEECACTRSDIKIFNLGLPKAGSSSFHNLMRQMGCKSAHQDVDPFQPRLKEINVSETKMTRKTIRYIGRLMELAYWNEKPLLYFINDKINAFSQLDMNYIVQKIAPFDTVFPQLIYYDLLFHQYPGSKFVLIKRNISIHINSISAWSNMRHRMINANIPYLPAGKGASDREMEIWIEGHYRRVTEYFNAVAPEQFLSVWLEEKPWSKIAAFLGCTGNYTWPCINSHTHECR